MTKEFSLFCLLVIVSSQLSFAQLYPVQVNTQLIPPYSLKLSDYATTTSEKLLLNLLLTDVSEGSLQVRLRFSIGGDINIRSTDFVQNAAPILLSGGIPLRLSNLDLRPYFELKNLQGITQQQYNTPLPDGLYQFCFEVFDQVTGRPLSQKKCVPVYLIMNDPPFLNLPQRGEQIMTQNPQNILFQWTPRHLNATGVQYTFELRELWDNQVDPQAAFLASPNLYSTTTFSTTLLYGPGETTLLEDRTYAWRVRALVTDGISETSVFKNNGHSEIFNFTYTGQCDAPKFVLATADGITWQSNPKHLQYRVQYRKKGGSNTIWVERETVENTKKLYFLEPDTTYEFRAGGQCMPNGGYTYSQINTFTTPSKEEENSSVYNCGIAPEIIITNQNPLEQLGVNETFTAGDFPVTVKEVYGGNGTFSGKGLIEVPYLAFVKIAVVFNNIRINTDHQLIDGVVETSYDANWSGIVDVDQAIEDIKMTLAQLVEMLSNIGIDSTTRENIKNLTDMLVQQAQAELPQPIAQNIQEATEKMQDAKEKYDAAIKNGNTELADQAENEFKDGQKALKDAEKERKDFLDTYASIIKNALKEIVRESNNKMENGLEQYGEASIVVKETNQALELTSTNLDELSAVFVTEESSANEQELIGRFEYERWKMLNYIAINLQTDEGTQELGKLLKNEGETLGVYIYNRLEEGVKKNALTTEVKELIIQIITEKIALSTKLF